MGTGVPELFCSRAAFSHLTNTPRKRIFPNMTGEELETAAITLSGRHRRAGPYRFGAVRWLQQQLTPPVHTVTLDRWMARTTTPIPKWAERQVAALLAKHNSHGDTTCKDTALKD